MQFFILILLLCLVIFLFCLYAISKDDLVFLRKDISIEKIFNLTFIMAIASLLLARFFYGILFSADIFANPLKFFLFPYFPGLSLVGAVIGAVVFMLFLRKKELPLSRLFDFFSVSFLITLPFGYLGYFLLAKKNIFTIEPLFLIIVYIILSIFFLVYLLPQFLKKKLEDGTLGFLVLTVFAAVSLAKNYLEEGTIFMQVEDFILLLILLIPLVYILDREKLAEKIKKIWSRK